MSNDFCRVFSVDQAGYEGQCLVVLNIQADPDPTINITINPESDVVGLCEIELVFNDTESAQKAFDEFTQETADLAVEALMETVNRIGADEDEDEDSDGY